MWITTSTLFLGFAVFLDFIELISPMKSLKDLFPGYNGVLPPIKEVSSETIERLHNFKQLYGRNMNPKDRVFLARDNFIVGYMKLLFIDPLCFLINEHDIHVVFNITGDQWEEMHPEEYRKLGPFRRFSLVRARDEVAATHVLESNATEIEKRAHTQACKIANLATDLTEVTQEAYIRRGARSVDLCIRKIKEEYNYEYHCTFKLWTRERVGQSSRPVRINNQEA